MQPRITDPGKIAPEAYKALFNLEAALSRSKIPASTRHLVKLRASQINGCAACTDLHAYEAKKAGETDERLWSVAAWRESPCFTDEERAALNLTEAATRIADDPAGVPDDVWDEAADIYDEESLVSLVMAIAAINAWNRISVTTRQLGGSLRA